jgi:hypothetical protein
MGMDTEKSCLHIVLADVASFVGQRLCIRSGMESWSHPSGAFTLLGDAVHATLPYLASGYVFPTISLDMLHLLTVVQCWYGS